MIRQYVEDNAAFEPEAIASMSEAFAQACNQLGIFAGDEHGREVIAVRIIDLARGGITDAASLAQRVLEESRAAA